MKTAVGPWGVLPLLFLAGCFAEDNEDTLESSIKPGEIQYFTREFEKAGDLTIELETAVGQFNVYIVNETDLEKVGTGKPFYAHASWRNVTSLDETIRLEPGDYAVTLLCEAKVEECEFKVTLRTT